MTADLVAFLRARLDEDALWATEASRRGDSDAVPGGAHWQWEDADTDEAVISDPGRNEYVDEDCSAVSLRSVEEFPTHSVGDLPQFAISRGECVPSAVGGHIIRHDPARVLAEITAKRRMIDEVAAAHASAIDMEHACCHEPGQILAGECDQFAPDNLPLLRLLALPYAGVDGYRREWSPDA